MTGLQPCGASLDLTLAHRGFHPILPGERRLGSASGFI